MLISKFDLRTMQNGNLSPFSKNLQRNVPSSVIMSRSKNVACLALFSSFSSNSSEYMHLKDFENSSSLFIARRSSMTQLVALYLYVLLTF